MKIYEVFEKMCYNMPNTKIKEEHEMAKITLEESDIISIAQLYSMHSVSLSHYNTTIMARMSEEAEDFYIRRLHIRTSKTNNKKTI